MHNNKLLFKYPEKPNDEKEYSFFRYKMVKEQLLNQFMISSKEIFQVEYSKHRIPVLFYIQ